MRSALIEGLSILAFMTLVAFCASCLPQAKHDPVSPDFHLARGAQ